MSQPPLVSMAILYQNQNFLMQLRDDYEHIICPGQWGLFGGHLEQEETPQSGLVREVIEEINYFINKPTFFKSYNDDKAQRYIYFAALDQSLSKLELNEGQDLDLVSIQSIREGQHYSSKIRQTRKLGAIHRQILLDFFEFANNNLSGFCFNQ